MGQKSFSFIGLLILATGKTLATFLLSGNFSLSNDESSATGLVNFTGMLLKPLEQ